MSDKLLVGTKKGLFRFERTRGKWSSVAHWFLGVPVSLVLSDSVDGRLYAALDHGHFGVKLHRSEDDGETWEELPAPTFPPKPENVEDKDPVRGVEIPWSTQLIWALEKAGGDDDLWCGVIPGGLFFSQDAGESWELNRPLWDDDLRQKWVGGGYDFAGIHSVLVDPRNTDHVTVGVSVGGVWKSYDKGKSWALVGEGQRAEYLPPEMQLDLIGQDPHRIVHCAAQPDHMWMQHHCGIFKSEDAGIHWEELPEVKPSGFGFAVGVHPVNPDIAWFVPAIKDEKRIPVDGKFVVTRTRDGGKTMEILTRGLPEGPAYDLVYRHALDVDETGDRVTFGSTTGSLWMSENKGEEWNTLSNHLPPVLCVQFERA